MVIKDLNGVYSTRGITERTVSFVIDVCLPRARSNLPVAESFEQRWPPALVLC